MSEQIARDILLVRAIESTDTARELLSEDDRRYATESAMKLAQWDAADGQSALTPTLLLQRRSELLIKKMTERHPSFATFAAHRQGVRLVGIALPALALVAGFAIERIADPHRVDLLSAPLLLILGWNVAVYLVLLASLFMPALPMPRFAAGLWTRLSTFKTVLPRKLPPPLALALAQFATEWLALSAPLNGARVKRVVHLSSACFAIGAVGALYAHGVTARYQAGWESTWLDSGQLHAILTLLFTPASLVFQLPGFSIADVQALQLPQSVASANGALWVHLYGATLFLFVVLPRLLLALAARWKEKKLAARFPVDLRQPYFRQISGHIGFAEPTLLRVFPYSFKVDELRDRGLATVANMLLGEQARVMLRPPTAYGEELTNEPLHDAIKAVDIAHTVALFNLSATPEKENHGAFIDQFTRGKTPDFSVMVDESGYLERLGAQAGADARMLERIALWRQFCDLHQVQLSIVNLVQPEARAEDIKRGLATTWSAP
ncbi:MAG: DUF2868 domain-containing protein [Gammaproteobacteria bacterium]|nr:DUF2868 domain-containing protein [Rhodoferax sp.]MBU3898095.1 DUF2868 domain-containing protein [Gammaproteobacteria bacterium]MBU3999148.1 DUF2868 domain-containing protein [Gammaproteobacteria bacterium]MBU4081711.1 DUF2868 domain-containing protein [Gammaproteobacteria bacterium]MBU4114633.1 DUF2868 domain-containing protein [Gammaproteobacteria bacterium]